MLLVGLVSGCEDQTKSSSAGQSEQPEKPRDHAAEAKEEDKQAAERLADAKSIHAEASKWLSAGNHAVFKGDKESMKKLIANLYAAGATNVEAVDIAALGGGELCASFVVTMPQDAKARAKVIEEANVFFTHNGDEPDDAVKDAGQKYLVLQTD